MWAGSYTCSPQNCGQLPKKQKCLHRTLGVDYSHENQLELAQDMAIILSRWSNTGIQAIQGPSCFLVLWKILNSDSSWAFPTPRRHTEGVNTQVDIHFNLFAYATSVFFFLFKMRFF